LWRGFAALSAAAALPAAAIATAISDRTAAAPVAAAATIAGIVTPAAAPTGATTFGLRQDYARHFSGLGGIDRKLRRRILRQRGKRKQAKTCRQSSQSTRFQKRTTGHSRISNPPRRTIGDDLGNRNIRVALSGR
jgi:hypothetical protein